MRRNFNLISNIYKKYEVNILIKIFLKSFNTEIFVLYYLIKFISKI